MPKDGELNELMNWRPTSLFLVFYKIYANLIYNIISLQLFRHHFETNTNFRIEDLLLFTEVAIERNQELQLHVVMLNMNMRKSFETIGHIALMQAIRSKALSDNYIVTGNIIFRSKNMINHNLDLFQFNK